MVLGLGLAKRESEMVSCPLKHHATGICCPLNRIRELGFNEPFMMNLPLYIHSSNSFSSTRPLSPMRPSDVEQIEEMTDRTEPTVHPRWKRPKTGPVK